MWLLGVASWLLLCCYGVARWFARCCFARCCYGVARWLLCVAMVL